MSLGRCHLTFYQGPWSKTIFMSQSILSMDSTHFWVHCTIYLHFFYNLMSTTFSLYYWNCESLPMEVWFNNYWFDSYRTKWYFVSCHYILTPLLGHSEVLSRNLTPSHLTHGTHWTCWRIEWTLVSPFIHLLMNTYSLNTWYRHGRC